MEAIQCLMIIPQNKRLAIGLIFRKNVPAAEILVSLSIYTDTWLWMSTCFFQRITYLKAVS